MKKIIIVGGGATGTFFSSAVKKNFPHFDVIMIHDPNTPYIGVGESIAFNGTRFIKKYLGINDDIGLMRDTNSSLKLGVIWQGFDNTDKQVISPSPAPYPSASSVISHLKFGSDLETENYLGQFNLYDVWLYLKRKNKISKDSRECINKNFWFCENSKIPFVFNPNDTLDHIAYSYHINSGTIKDYVFDVVGKPLGVKEIQKKVKEVHVKPDGSENIEYLTLDDGEKIFGDLFIDATGFSRQLVKELSFKFNPSDESINNSTLVGLHSFTAPEENSCFSGSLSMKYGWCFSVPMNTRSGNGYQFNSSFVNNEQMLIDEFYEKQPSKKDISFKRLSWQPGYLDKAFVGNCLPLGISIGFSDAFDANNFSSTMILMGLIIDHLKEDENFEFAWRKHYNDYFNSLVSDITLRHHTFFHLSPRNDTEYWQEMKVFAKKFNTLERLYDACFDEKRKRPRDNNNPVLYFQPSFIHLCNYYDLPVYNDDRLNLSLSSEDEKLFLQFFEKNSSENFEISKNALDFRKLGK